MTVSIATNVPDTSYRYRKLSRTAPVSRNQAYTTPVAPDVPPVTVSPSVKFPDGAAMTTRTSVVGTLRPIA